MSVVELGQGSLVALLGCAGSGKTSFAHRHFARYQVLSRRVPRSTMDELRELRMSLRYVGAEELDRRYPATSTGGG